MNVRLPHFISWRFKVYFVTCLTNFWINVQPKIKCKYNNHNNRKNIWMRITWRYPNSTYLDSVFTYIFLWSRQKFPFCVYFVDVPLFSIRFRQFILIRYLIIEKWVLTNLLTFRDFVMKRTQIASMLKFTSLKIK